MASPVKIASHFELSTPRRGGITHMVLSPDVYTWDAAAISDKTSKAKAKKQVTFKPTLTAMSLFDAIDQPVKLSKVKEAVEIADTTPISPSPFVRPRHLHSADAKMDVRPLEKFILTRGEKLVLLRQNEKKFRQEEGRTGWFSTGQKDNGRVGHPPQDMDYHGLQHGDLYLNWVTFPLICQVWRYMDGFWYPLQWGHLAHDYVPNRRLVITGSNIPSFVQDSTYRKAYKKLSPGNIIF